MLLGLGLEVSVQILIVQQVLLTIELCLQPPMCFTNSGTTTTKMSLLFFLLKCTDCVKAYTITSHYYNKIPKENKLREK